MVDRRYSTRIPGGYWLAMEGQDDTPIMRAGDISLSGAYFPVDSHPGAVGSRVYLHLAASDWSLSLQVIAKVVRIALVDDLVRGLTPIGVAVEFILESEEEHEQMAKLVTRIAELERANRASLADVPDLAAAIQSESETLRSGPREEAGVHEVSLDTDWAPEQGERLVVTVVRPRTRRQLNLETIVSSTRHDPDRPKHYSVRLQVLKGDVALPVSASGGADAACRKMLADTMQADEPVPGERLGGSLCRSICVPSVLSFLAQEALSGELLVKSPDGQRALVYLSGGRVVDADAAGGLSAQEILMELIRWEEGSFEFHEREVSRANLFNMGTTELLLELSAAADELVR